MIYKPTGTNKDEIDEISYLTRENLLHVDNGIPKPYSAGQDVLNDDNISRLIQEVDTYVWPEIPKGDKYIPRTANRTTMIEGINFSTASLHKLSIIARLFRSTN